MPLLDVDLIVSHQASANYRSLTMSADMIRFREPYNREQWKLLVVTDADHIMSQKEL